MRNSPGNTGDSRATLLGRPATSLRSWITLFATILLAVVVRPVPGQSAVPHVSDGIQYVATGGLDSNSGNSWAAAVKTWAQAEANLNCRGEVRFSPAFKTTLSSDPFSRFHQGGCAQTVRMGANSLITTNAQIVVPNGVYIVGNSSDSRIFAGPSFPAGTTVVGGGASRNSGVVSLSLTEPRSYAAGTLLSLSGFASINGPCLVLTSSGTSVTCSQTGPDIASDGNGHVNVPIVVLGDGFDFASPNLFGGHTMLRFLTVNCGNIPGTIGFYSDQIQERSGLEDVLANNCTDAGIRIEQYGNARGGSPQNFVLKDLYVLMGSSAPPTARGIELVSTRGAMYDRSGIQGATVADVSGASNRIAAGIYIRGVFGMRIASIHCEYTVDCVQIDKNSGAISVDNVVGNPTVTSVLHIDRATGISFIEVRAISSNSSKYSIEDDLSDVVLRDPLIGFYDHTTGSRCFTSQTDSTCAYPSQTTAGTITLSGGSGFHDFAGAYRSAPVCTASDAIRAAPVRVVSTRTMVSVSGAGNDVIRWICTPTAN